MKIQCLIERPNGSEVTFDATDRWPKGHYHFRPDTPGGPHVADVEEEMHVHRLLGMPDVYRVYVEDGKADKPQRPETPPPTGDSDADAPSGAVVPPKQPEDAPDAAAVQAIRDLSIKDLKAQINTYPREQLVAALEAEKASKDEPPRKGWIEVAEAHLGTAG